MAQREIEIILLRRWASYLAMPIFLVGAAGDLLYFNAAASELLGQPFDDAGEMPVERLAAIFATATHNGEPLAAEDLPIGRALITRRPAHGRLTFTALDGVKHTIDVTGLPLHGQGDLFIGVMAVFWEIEDA